MDSPLKAAKRIMGVSGGKTTQGAKGRDYLQTSAASTVAAVFT
jgi:hypothetical protein